MFAFMWDTQRAGFAKCGTTSSLHWASSSMLMVVVRCCCYYYALVRLQEMEGLLSLLNAESATTLVPEEWYILSNAEYIPLRCPRVELCQHPGALRKSFRILPLGENRKRLET
jgi:hypothetical protein